jgi:hypothetical protein
MEALRALCHRSSDGDAAEPVLALGYSGHAIKPVKQNQPLRLSPQAV